MERELRLIATTALVTLLTIGAGAGLSLRDDGILFPDGTLQTSALAPAPAPVEDTGQSQCADENGNGRACAGTGEDGEFQAGVAWPTPRFADNGDGTITDNLTGLVWLKDANCPGSTKTWQEALDWVGDLNTSSIACTDYTAMTYADWRLPNFKEIQSLVDYGVSSPSLPFPNPFVGVQLSVYWSSSSFLSFQSEAWVVLMTNGGAFADGKTKSYNVWPVRGGQ